MHRGAGPLSHAPCHASEQQGVAYVFDMASPCKCQLVQLLQAVLVWHAMATLLNILSRHAHCRPLYSTPCCHPAPKAAKEDYEHFLRAVGSLAGGEVPSNELQQLSALVWDGLQAMQTPVQLPLKKTGFLRTAQLRPAVAALQPLMPGMGSDPEAESALAKVVELADSLKQWEAKVGPGSKDAVRAAVGAAAAGNVTSSGALASASAGQVAIEEFGSDLDWATEPASAAGSWLLCGAVHGTSGTSCAETATAAAAAAGVTTSAASTLTAVGAGMPVGGFASGAEPSPVELRQMFAANAATPGDAGGAGMYSLYRSDAEDVARGLDEAVDIDSDDERKGRGNAPGLLWLRRWCVSVGGDDQVGCCSEKWSRIAQA